MKFERSLDPREVNLRHLEPACSLRYEGALDIPLLEKSFRILSDRYAVLRSCIRDGAGSQTLYLPSDHYPDLVRVTGSREELLQRMRYPQRIEHGVCRLIVADDRSAGDRGWVALQINHAVMDGRTAQSLFAELWVIYTKLISGEKVSVESPFGLSRPPTDFVDDNLPLIRELLRGAPNPFSLAASKPEVGEFPHEQWIGLTVEETSLLIAAARTLQTSVHALVCGSMLSSSRSRLSFPEPVPMQCCSIVDLRARARDPIGPLETANFSVWACVDVVVAPDDSPISIGRNVKQGLETTVAKKDSISARPAVDKDVERQGYAHFLKIEVTNPGVIRPFSSPPDLRFIEFQWLHAVANQYPVKSSNAVYAVYTFNGQMTINGIFPSDLFSETDVECIGKDLRAALREICDLGR